MSVKFTTIILLVIVFAVSRVSATEKTPILPNDTEFVVLFHGLGRTERSLNDLEKRLIKEGYAVISASYPSLKKSTDHMVKHFVNPTLNKPPISTAKRFHIVTHSLGGVLIRTAFSNGVPQNLARVVMMGPPNQGSEVIDYYQKSALHKRALGPGGMSLGTSTSGIPAKLGPVGFELGVIAGNKSVNPWLSRIIPGEDDGKVSVENTKVDGMQDFIVLPHSHTFMMNRTAVQDQIVHFLKHGSFQHNHTESEGSDE